MTESIASDERSPDRPPEDPYEIRRRAWLFVLIAVVAAGLAAGYGWLALDRERPELWGATAVLGLLAVRFAWALRRARVPLLVADEHGVRLQSPDGWLGFLWREMAEIAVFPRRGIQRAAYVLVRGADDESVSHLVPLGLSTTSSAAEAEVELARRRAAASY